MCCAHAVTAAMVLQGKQDLILDFDFGDGTTSLMCPFKISSSMQQGTELNTCTLDDVYGYSLMHGIHGDHSRHITRLPEKHGVQHHELQAKEVCVVQLCD
jgi:hypothetical protein